MSVLSELMVDMNAAPLLVSVGAGITVMLVIAALASMRSPVRARASSRVAAFGSVDRMYQPTINPLYDRRVSNIPLIESLFGGRTWVERTRETLGRAGIPLRAGEYLALRALAVTASIALAFLLAQRIGGEPLVRMIAAAAGIGIGFFGPPFAVNRRLKRRQQQIETQLVELCDVMASMLQSGYGYSQALRATAEEVGPPLSGELQRLLDSVQLGGDIDEALEELNERLGSRDFDMVASAIAIQRRSGGNLSEILVGVAETIRQRQSFFREVAALTAKERFTALFVAAFPLGLIAVLIWMAPDPYARLLTDTAGRIMLGIAIGLDMVGFFIIRKLTQVEV